MAKRANELTLKNFGRVIHLYSPLYLSNFCDMNACTAVSTFKRHNQKKLCLEEVELEAKLLRQQNTSSVDADRRVPERDACFLH